MQYKMKYEKFRCCIGGHVSKLVSQEEKEAKTTTNWIATRAYFIIEEEKKIFFSFNLLNEKIFWKKKNLSLNGNDPISVEINLKIVKK